LGRSFHGARGHGRNRTGASVSDATDRGNRGFFWFGPKGTVTPLRHDLTNRSLTRGLD